jgi:putative ABC transport system permease protein
MYRLRQDLVVALRGFRRTPTFPVAVLAILGLGIGMAVAMFTTFQTILIRRLPVRDQERIAVISPYRDPTVVLAPPASDLTEARRSSRTIRDIAGVAHWGIVTAPFVGEDRTIVLRKTLVTSNYFDVVGARPQLGRLLRPDDEEPGAPLVMVLSYGVWQTQFGGSPSVIGLKLIDPYPRSAYTIVGVAPPGLDYPVGVGVWIPITRGGSTRVLAVARLAPGANIDAARAEFFSIVRRLQPGWDLTGATAQTFAQAVLGKVRPIVGALSAAVALLLLIGCVNVSNLFILRASARARELAVRRAVGAGSFDLVRQLVVESAVLVAAGGVLGVGCAIVLVRALVAFAPPQLPRLDDVRLHGSMLGAALGVTALCVFLVGLLPALAAVRMNPAFPLRHNARSGTDTRRRRRIRTSLVASQVALTIVMLAGAGLLMRTVVKLENLELGYESEHLSIVSVAFDRAKYASADEMVDWGEQVEQRIRAIPGVVAVTPILMAPFVGRNVTIALFEPEGDMATERDAALISPFETAGTQSFQAFGMPVIRGRGFLESDRRNATVVVVVSESVARRFWPGEDPLGKRLRFSPSDPVRFPPAGFYDWRTVIGVVGDTHFRTLRESSPMVYFPWRQSPAWSGNFAVRSRGDLAAVTPAMRRAVKDVDPTLTLWDVRTMDALLGAPLAEPRFSAFLLTAFGAVALILAAVGLYGVMASAVREQTREIGIRIAVGATPANIRRAVVRQALAIAAAGSCAGLAASLATTRVLRTLLFNVSPADPATLASVCVLLLIIAALAAYLPAYRATRVDPVHALRAD